MILVAWIDALARCGVPASYERAVEALGPCCPGKEEIFSQYAPHETG